MSYPNVTLCIPSAFFAKARSIVGDNLIGEDGGHCLDDGLWSTTYNHSQLGGVSFEDVLVDARIPFDIDIGPCDEYAAREKSFRIDAGGGLVFTDIDSIDLDYIGLDKLKAALSLGGGELERVVKSHEKAVYVMPWPEQLKLLKSTLQPSGLSFDEVVDEYKQRGIGFTAREVKTLKALPHWVGECVKCAVCGQVLLHDDVVRDDFHTGVTLCEKHSEYHPTLDEWVLIMDDV